MSEQTDTTGQASETESKDSRKCVNGLSPDTPVKFPAESEFGAAMLLESKELQKIADGLIRKAKLGLGDVLEAEVDMRLCWRKRAPSYRGKRQLCSIKKAGGDLQFFTGADYLIYVSADLGREYSLTHWQLEAAIYSALCEVKVETDTEGNTSLSMRAPDVIAFASEIKHYGLWTSELGAMKETFSQASLFASDLATFERQRKAQEPKEAKTEESRERRSNGGRA